MREEDRSWIDTFRNKPETVLDDWQPFCQNPNGVVWKSRYENIPPELPTELLDIKKRFTSIIPDERSHRDPKAPHNGPRYYLRSYVEDKRRFGEKTGCELVFGPSDYRTFLATNGMERDWAEQIGMGDEWRSRHHWFLKWRDLLPNELHFENSFGVNVLVSAIGDDGQRHAIFRERQGTAVRPHSTVGTVDEGLRRAYDKYGLFDQKSARNKAPCLRKAVARGLSEEAGFEPNILTDREPIFLSIGRVISLRQPAALVHLPLTSTIHDVYKAEVFAPDRKLEFRSRSIHSVALNEKNIVEFVMHQEKHAPVETWVIAMALYATKTKLYGRAFICHSQHDQHFATDLRRRLSREGVPVTILPEHAIPGQDIEDSINMGIRHSDKMIVICSPKSLARPWVKEEIKNGLALERSSRIHRQKRNILIPLLRDASCLDLSDDLFSFLHDRTILDFRPRRPHEPEFQKLLQSLEESRRNG